MGIDPDSSLNLLKWTVFLLNKGQDTSTIELEIYYSTILKILKNYVKMKGWGGDSPCRWKPIYSFIYPYLWSLWSLGYRLLAELIE